MVTNGYDQDGTEYVHITDALGTGIDMRVFRNRGILSFVFYVDGEALDGVPSADVDMDDVMSAMQTICR